MRMSGEEYSKRLEGFSDDTLRLISEVNRTIPRNKVREAIDIRTDPNLNEEQIVQKLKELLASE
ncbi:MAG: hypothetical protein IKD18_00665 [Clostridia bacterium]|nr:hypothetical protein [Clostridia bacterium]